MVNIKGFVNCASVLQGTLIQIKGDSHDEGDLWPVAFVLKGLTATEEAKSRTLVKKAVS